LDTVSQKSESLIEWVGMMFTVGSQRGTNPKIEHKPKREREVRKKI
jgi:hypothetical protein